MRQQLNFGSAANDGTGDPLRIATAKLNANFDQLFGGLTPIATPFMGCVSQGGNFPTGRLPAANATYVYARAPMFLPYGLAAGAPALVGLACAWLAATDTTSENFTSTMIYQHVTLVGWVAASQAEARPTSAGAPGAGP